MTHDTDADVDARHILKLTHDTDIDVDDRHILTMTHDTDADIGARHILTMTYDTNTDIFCPSRSSVGRALVTKFITTPSSTSLCILTTQPLPH